MMIKRWKGIVALVLALGFLSSILDYFLRWYPSDQERSTITTDG